jgi:thymidylate synthase
MHNFVIRNEASFLYNAVDLCRENKSGNDGAWQVAPFQCSIPFSEQTLENIGALKQRIRASFPALYDYGANRANKAYNSSGDTITKPSYNTRIENYLGSGLNQLDCIENIGSQERCSGGLVFSVFSPEDLVRRNRPGYVPCLIAGSFLEHEGELQLNVFFRSQSVVEFGIFDLEFLRKMQVEMVSRICDAKDEPAYVQAGSLNLHFARILVQRRLQRNRHGFIKRDHVLEDWLRVVEDFVLEA